MKTLIFILCFPILGFGQTVTDTCFTTQQIHDISETLDNLYYTDSINNTLITQQESVIIKQDQLIRLDSVQLVYKQQQIDLLESNINLYVKQQKQLQPKWFNHKMVWFSAGILTSILAAKLIIEVIQ